MNEQRELGLDATAQKLVGVLGYEYAKYLDAPGKRRRLAR